MSPALSKHRIIFKTSSYLIKQAVSIMAPKSKQSTKKTKISTTRENDYEERSSKKPRLDSDEENSDEGTKEWNWKIITWNIAGLRSWLKKDGLSIFKNESPDVICLQETKCSEEKMPPEMKKIKGYKSFFYSAKKEGYSGLAMFSKAEPISVSYGIGADIHDDEARCITAEFKKFFLVNAYVPNAGRKLVSLDKRMDWDPKLKKHLQQLDEKKPVIYCGDLNVAHKEIDLKNPKTNTRNAGFTKEERDGFTDLLSAGFVDTFRHLYPDKKDQYTFWTYMMNCRAKNVGWRLDYFVISERILPNLCDNVIESSVMGSDHCPIKLLMKF